MVEGLLLYYQQIGFVRFISGSQLAVWYYRALGAKIGQGVLLNGLHRWATCQSLAWCAACSM